jgi:hypothetical protein
VRVGQRRVRVRRSALDEFVAADETPATEADNEAAPAEPDTNAEDFARLGAALADSTAALNSEDHATLAEALALVADAAARLADGLRDQT